MTNSFSAYQQLNSLLHLINSSLQTLPITQLHLPDQLIFSLTNKLFSSATFYKFLTLHPKITSSLNLVWSLEVPPRVKTFIWLLLQNKLATIDNLQKRGLMLVNICTLCKAACETAFHITNSCPYFMHTLHLVLFLSGTPATYPSYPATMQLALLSKETSTIYKQLLAISYYFIWKERCGRIFREVSNTPSISANLILQEWSFSQLLKGVESPALS
ncbi:hypothetical protein LUZ61_013830 [Rhynchospora tenuis]|uniref:Reverse transcriptase zinc-binding domain-containing protein n=1 Tax=Rhynchospora tenuis TaxID=198213 RepID=A0AAD5Z2X2_9POAL|nr:hypothetical protein LUZ61_013830 [Rhynchospora tenuis]